MPEEFRVAEVARLRGIENPHQLALRAGRTVNPVRALWENKSERPATSLLRAVSRALHVEISQLYAPDPQLEVWPLE